MSSDPQAQTRLRATETTEQQLRWSMLGALRGRFIVFDENLLVEGCAGRDLERCGLDRNDLIGGQLAAVLPGSFEEHEPRCRAALEGESSTVEVSSDAGRIYEIEFSPARTEAGMPHSGLAIVRDITETHRAHEALAATELFENAFTNAPIGMALVSLEGTFMKVNGATCELLGYPEPELLALTFQEITHPDDLEADLRQVQRLVAGEIERYSMPKRYYTKAGEEVWANLSVSLVRDDAGEPVHFISQIEDISDRKRLEAALQHLADHDPLTGLWNRRAFDQELERELARCRRHGLEAALLLVDLNHFKHVNDTYGHSAGDELLRKIAAKLQARLRSTDSIARLGGDEFVIILPNTSLERAARVAAAVEDEVRTAGSHVGEQEAYVTASVGVAALNETTADARAVMADADRAMYRAKQRG